MKFFRATVKIFLVALVVAVGGLLAGTGTGSSPFAEETVSRVTPLHFDFTPEDFEDALKSGKPTFLDISATWCPPCYQAAPAVEELKKVYGGEANIMTVNYDQHKSFVAKYGVRMLPSFIFFNKKGKQSEVMAGFDGKEKLESVLKGLLN